MALTKKNIARPPYNGPSITGYNRLEGVPVSQDYRKSLQAPVHDALWMLTRQWQMGEFDGEDTGTAVKAKVLTSQQQVTHFATGDKNIYPIDTSAMPLEMVVEREGRTADLALRIELGKLFKEMLGEYELDGYFSDFLEAFRLQLLEENEKDAGNKQLLTAVRSNRNDLLLFDALKNRVLDGFVIFSALTYKDRYSDWAYGRFDQATAEAAIKAGQRFLEQVTLFYGHDFLLQNTSWQSGSLDYGFSVQTSADPKDATILDVDHYPGGRLDWYSFDLKQVTDSNSTEATYTSIPTPVTYPGMPKPRWWEMEDSVINFGNVNVKATDIPSLLLIDFALLYGNDWLMIPFPMQLNRLCSIKGLLVKDVFGFHTYIPPVDTGSTVSWKKWSLFNQADAPGVAPNPVLYLAPTLLKPVDQEPLERVSFLRDEVSNMVWAFENVIPGAFSKGLQGAEVAATEIVEEQQPTKDAPVKYLLGKDVPFYQVPFVAVEIPFDATHSQIRLQRATMPQGTNPRGVLLTEVASPYYINEENISRAGTSVIRHWQRTRWINGTVAQWLGREKQAGKGEGGSNLTFDLLT